MSHTTATMVSSPRLVRQTVLAVATVVGIAAQVGVAVAAPVTFGQFTEVNTSAATVGFTNNGQQSATLNTVNTTPGDHITFTFTSITNLPAGLTGGQDGFLTINGGAGATTTEAAEKTGTGSRTQYFQPFNNQIVIRFTRSTPYIDHGVNYGTNLLTITLSGMNLDDPFLGSSGTNGSTPSIAFNNTEYMLTYTSDFLVFPTGSTEDGSLTFSAVTPGVGIAAGGKFLNSFAGNFTGTFAADPPPSTFIVPEPRSIALLAAGLLGLGVLVRRRA